MNRNRFARTSEYHGGPITAAQLLRAGLFALLGGLLLSAILTLNIIPRAYEFREGDVSPTNIRSPRKLSYVSQLKTRAEKERAAAAVGEVWEIDLDLVARERRELGQLLLDVSTVRNNTSLSPEQKAQQIKPLVQPPLSDQTTTLLVTVDNQRWLAISSEAQRLIGEVLREKIAESRVPEVRRELPLRVGLQFSDLERQGIVELASRFVVPNLRLNAEATARLRKEAQDAVSEVRESVEQGEIVIREGQVITALELEKLEALGLRNPTTDWRGVAAGTLLVFAGLALLGGYCAVFQPDVIVRERRLLLVGLVMVVTLLGAKLVLPTRPLWAYGFPLAGVAMVLATLLEARLAILVCTLLAVLIGYLLGGSLELATVLALGSAVAAIGVHHRERIRAYFVTGLAVAAVQLLAVTAFFLAARTDDVVTLVMTGFGSLANGTLSAALAVGTFSVLGPMFGITTTLHLLELANPTQPLLRRLLMEAPGTYHHSIMVGNLAERAAELIGADPLLVRVAAYYHDIGKLKRPYFFIENQAGGENIHDSLAPEVSAQILAAHVSDGVELAERYGLPPVIRDMIPQHHGTRLISFLYHKAVEQGKGPVDPEQFRYKGPKPQSKEAAILMLADSVEASARASRDHSPEAIARLVDEIVLQRLAEGQFDECDLTLRDLDMIKQAFRTLLTGIYHPRIEYPEAARRATLPAQAEPAPQQLPPGG
jgi:putative nucleotidyltransferase with HDIG domain